MKKMFRILIFLSLFVLVFAPSYASASKKYVGSKNKVYGHLTRKVKKKSPGYYKDKELTYVFYGVSNHKTINVVKENFKDMPLNRDLDSESIDEHIHDFIEKDATLVSQDNDQRIYQSNKIGKKYIVQFTNDNSGDISWIKILREDVNE